MEKKMEDIDVIREMMQKWNECHILWRSIYGNDIDEMFAKWFSMQIEGKRNK